MHDAVLPEAALHIQVGRRTDSSADPVSPAAAAAKDPCAGQVHHCPSKQIRESKRGAQAETENREDLACGHNRRKRIHSPPPAAARAATGAG